MPQKIGPATRMAPGPRPGSDRISTRRSAFSTGVSSPARSSRGRMVSKAHRQALLCGTGVSCGSALRISGQSGVVLAFSTAWRYSSGSSSIVPRFWVIGFLA